MNIFEHHLSEIKKLIISEKKSVEIITPTKIDFEKSVLGKNNKPIIKPNKIDEYAFFSLNFLL